MKRISFTCRALVLVLALLVCAPAVGYSADYTRAIEHARTIVRKYVRATGAPALQIAVEVDGKIVWSEAFGEADIANHTRATTRSQFRIASISKLLTGTLTAGLADSGVLDLDRPIGDYVPNLPAAWHDITADMLVHHTSGIAHYSSEKDALDTTFYPTTRDAIRRFENRPLAHPPGVSETYSSYAYTVLALAIEQATGESFLKVMRQELLRPLGMTHTEPDLQKAPPPERTRFYDLTDGDSIAVAPYIDLSGRWAGSGFLSTAEDLVRFGMAHTDSGQLPQSVRALVGQREKLPGGTMTKEAFGWGPRHDWDGRPMLWGDGSTQGSRCGLLVYPRDNLAIAILTNLDGLALERGELQTLAHLFFGVRQKEEVAACRPEAIGSWRAKVPVKKAEVGVDLDIRTITPVTGSLTIEGWRSLEIADIFRFDDTTWVVTLDRQGMLPLTFVPERNEMAASIPRIGWSLTLHRKSGTTTDNR